MFLTAKNKEKFNKICQNAWQINKKGVKYISITPFYNVKEVIANT